MLLPIVFMPIRQMFIKWSIIIRLYSEHRMFELSIVGIVFLSSNRGFRKGAEFFSTYQGFRLIEVRLIEVPLSLKRIKIEKYSHNLF